MKRRQLVIGILVLAGLIAAGAWIVSYFSEEAKIKRAVAEGVRAFEAKNLDGSLKIVSEKYLDAQGWDKARIREGLVRLFVQFSELKAEVTGLKVNLEKDKATVKCEIRVRGKSEGTLMFLVGTLTSKEEAVLYFAREEGTWRLTRVEGLGVRE